MKTLNSSLVIIGFISVLTFLSGSIKGQENTGIFQSLDSICTFNFEPEGDSAASYNHTFTSNDHGLAETDSLSLYENYSEAWVPYEIFEYAYDRFGIQTEKINYYWNSESMTRVPRSRSVVGFDFNGNDTMSVDYSWDADNSMWLVGSEKETRVYSNSGNLLMEGYSGWNSETGSLVMYAKTEYEYDAHNNQIKRTGSNNINETKEWRYISKSEFFYDEYNQDTLIIGYNWNQDSIRWDWSGMAKYLRTYDDKGRLRVNERLVWEISRNEWSPSSKYEYYFSELGDTIIEELFGPSYDTWILYTRKTNIYTNNGLTDTEIHHSNGWYNGERVIVLLNKYVYDYNEAGQSIGSETYYYESSEERWLGTEKFRSYFNSDGLQDHNEMYTWYDDVRSWKLRQRSWYYYSEADLIAPQLLIQKDTVNIGENIVVSCSEYGTVYLVLRDVMPEDDIENLSIEQVAVASSGPVLISTNDIIDTGAYLLYAKDLDQNISLASKVWILPKGVGVQQYTKLDYKIYPTQVSNVFRIDSAEPITQVKVYDLMGRLRKAFTDLEIDGEFDISDLESGLYCVQINKLKNQSTIIHKL